MTPADIIAADPVRMRLLAAVARLGLQEGAIGAGFVRNAVWDHLHGRAPSAPDGDIDVVWHDPLRLDAAADRAHEDALASSEPEFAWSVKNQARMHQRNGDAPYGSVAAAIARWPETATAIAVRLVAGRIETLAPYETADLMALVLRPTPAFCGERRCVVLARIAAKGWLARWQKLRLADALVDG